jgi:hypothetical protein
MYASCTLAARSARHDNFTLIGHLSDRSSRVGSCHVPLVHHGAWLWRGRRRARWRWWRLARWRGWLAGWRRLARRRLAWRRMGLARWRMGLGLGPGCDVRIWLSVLLLRTSTLLLLSASLLFPAARLLSWPHILHTAAAFVRFTRVSTPERASERIRRPGLQRISIWLSCADEFEPWQLRYARRLEAVRSLTACDRGRASRDNVHGNPARLGVRL